MSSSGEIVYEEVLSRHHSAAAWSSDDKFGAQSHGYGRVLGRRVGVDHTPPDCPSGADREMADQPCRPVQERRVLGHQLRKLDLALTGHSPDAELTGLMPNIGQL